MIKEPLVSVIIPTYNRGNLLPRAIKSVKNQNYNNWELIISDDGSQDRTKNLVREYSEKDSRIRYVTYGENKGVSAARNLGIAHAKGKYISFLDSDDEWLGQHLCNSVKVLEQENVQVALSLWYEKKHSKLYRIDEPYEGKDYFKIAVKDLGPVVKGELHFFQRKFYEYVLLEYFYFCHINTLILNKNVIENVGCFNEKLMPCEDTEFMLRVFRSYNVCFIRDYHFIYHYGEDNLHAFIDRENIDVEELASNKGQLEKLTDIELYKIRFRKVVKKSLKSSKEEIDYKKCVNTMNTAIADKYFTLGYINRSLNKKDAFYYYIKSLLFDFRITKFVFLARIFAPKLFSKIEVKRPDINLW